ncbi:MAG: TetR/AcrR family transcriptional regulator [Planctomycetes bacterium]|nr:TetR/AcrR family transcriptional regulator [Planctomycetota bacterium]
MATLTRKPTAERREEIVQAVLNIIGRQGLTSLTTSNLAKEVGVSTGAIFRHFATIDAILEQAVQHALEKIDATFPDAALPPLQRILELARNRVQVIGADPGLAWMLRSEQAYLTLPADAVRQLRQRVKRSKRYLLEAISEGAAQGDIRDDLAPEDLLVPILGTIHALIGMPGVHSGAGARHQTDSDRILKALLTMLAPPQTGRKRR